MTATNTAARISSVLLAANGRRRTRTANLAEVIELVRQLLLLGGPDRRLTQRVANCYGYAADGTYAAAARKSTGEVVVGVWVDSANRAGVMVGVNPSLRRADRIQAAVDALDAAEYAAAGRVVLTADEAADLVSGGGHGDEASLLRGIAAAPDDETTRLVYADYLDDAGRAEEAARIRVAVARS